MKLRLETHPPGLRLIVPFLNDAGYCTFEANGGGGESESLVRAALNAIAPGCLAVPKSLSELAREIADCYVFYTGDVPMGLIEDYRAAVEREKR